MDKILHYFKYPKLWELWYIPYYGSCRILSINPFNKVPVGLGGVPFEGLRFRVWGLRFSLGLGLRAYPKGYGTVTGTAKANYYK